MSRSELCGGAASARSAQHQLRERLSPAGLAVGIAPLRVVPTQRSIAAATVTAAAVIVTRAGIRTGACLRHSSPFDFLWSVGWQVAPY